MSQWSDRVTQHPVQTTLRNLRTLIQEFTLDFFQGNETRIESFERIHVVFDLVDKRIQSIDPIFIPNQALNSLHSLFSSVLSELKAYKHNKNDAHLVSANNLIDNILGQLVTLPIPILETDFESIKDSASAFRRSVGQFIRSIEDEIVTVRNKIKELTGDLSKFSNEVSTQKQRIDSVISDYQKQFSSGEEKQLTDFHNSEVERQKKIEDLINKKQAELSSLLEDKELEIDSLFQEAQENFSKIQTKIESDGANILTMITNEKEKAENLVGIITDTGMVGGYQRVANEEKVSARNWRKVALGSLMALVAFAIFAFVETLGHEIRWDQFATRIFVAASFGILAAYAALQADEHEKTERKNRKTELELASIIPYLHDLPQDKQHKIREELAMKMFGQADTLDFNNDKKTTGSVLDVLKMAMETIGNFSRK